MPYYDTSQDTTKSKSMSSCFLGGINHAAHLEDIFCRNESILCIFTALKKKLIELSRDVLR